MTTTHRDPATATTAPRTEAIDRWTANRKVPTSRWGETDEPARPIASGDLAFSMWQSIHVAGGMETEAPA